MVTAVDHKVPQARPADAYVPVGENLVGVLLLVGDELVTLAASHLHLLLVAGLVHEALSVTPELAAVRLES